MPTILAQIPTSNMNGTVTTPKVQLDPTVQYVEVKCAASDAVLSNPANVIDFAVVVSPSGQPNDPQEVEIQRYRWSGGTYTRKDNGQIAPLPIDVIFNLESRNAGWFCGLVAIFARPMTLSASLIALP
jgi:hypothetical protein